MKKTLQEEKERFRQIVEQGATNMAYGFKPNQNDEEKKDELPQMKPNSTQLPFTGDLDDAIGEFVLNCLESGMNHEGIKTIILNSVDDALEANDDNEGGRLFPQDDDEGPDANDIDSNGDEYGEQYDKNMSQGFSSINEGNAFVGAAKKAKEEGKDSFVLDGKTYKVTVSKSKK
jgi:hypothetical protein